MRIGLAPGLGALFLVAPRALSRRTSFRHRPSGGSLAAEALSSVNEPGHDRPTGLVRPVVALSRVAPTSGAPPAGPDNLRSGHQEPRPPPVALEPQGQGFQKLVTASAHLGVQALAFQRDRSDPGRPWPGLWRKVLDPHTPEEAGSLRVPGKSHRFPGETWRNNHRLVEGDPVRKGKPVERRGRKASGLKPKGQDSRAAETSWFLLALEPVRSSCAGFAVLWAIWSASMRPRRGQHYGWMLMASL